MRLIPSAATGPQAVLHVAANLQRRPASSAALLECHRHTLRAIQGVRAFFLDTPPVAAGVGGADSVGHRLLNNRRAAVVDVAGCSGSQTLSQLIVAGHLLHSRVCPVDRDADRHQWRARQAGWESDHRHPLSRLPAPGAKCARSLTIATFKAELVA